MHRTLGIAIGTVETLPEYSRARNDVTSIHIRCVQQSIRDSHNPRSGLLYKSRGLVIVDEPIMGENILFNKITDASRRAFR